MNYDDNKTTEPQGQKESLWTSTCKIDERPTLSEDFAETEAVVIGAGLAGVLTAYMLKEKGVDALIVESNSIGSGTTGYTTAKITAQHNLIYDRLISGLGMEKAKQYATANTEAIRAFQNLVNRKNIDCRFEEKTSFLYAMKDESIESLQKEAEAATKLGIPNALLMQEDLVQANGWGLPFTAKAALQFFGQAQYHPLNFLKEIAKDLKIFEKTRVIDVQQGGSKSVSQEGENSIVITETGKISARYVVFACHFPFLIFPGYYFARMYQDRTYIMALQGGLHINGLYLGIDKPSWSFRNYDEYMLIVGASHRTGENEKGGGYQTLRDEASKWFPQAVEKYAWSTQDCMPLDGVPYIGVYASDRPDWYVATGFQKWGMSSSMVAADIISSMISKKPMQVAIAGVDVFSPHRFTIPTSAKEAWDDVKTIGGGLLNEIFSMPEEEANSILKGHGGIVEYKGEKAGVFRDESNNLFITPTKCSHMGCQLAWNPEEKSWDCPCHGSRFNIDGKVISGPAIKPPGTLGANKSE